MLPRNSQTALALAILLIANADLTTAKPRAPMRAPKAHSRAVRKTAAAQATRAAPLAAAQAAPTPAPPPPPTIGPAEAILRAELAGAKSRDARNIGLATESLLKGDTAAAHKQIASVAKSGDPLFADYVAWIQSSIDREEARRLVGKKKFTDARALAKRALERLPQVEIKQAYSPLIRRLPEEIALTEAVIGDAEHGLKHWRSAQLAYEASFQRLLSAGALSSLPAETFGRYAETCAKDLKPDAMQTTSLCAAWVTRLTAAFSRNSDEFRAIVKQLPWALDKRPNPAANPRLSQSYKGTDPDLEAFDDAFDIYLTGKFDDAADAYRKALEEFPRSPSRFRAKYWLARATERDGDKDAAKKLYEDLARESPLSYYGMLASLATTQALPVPTPSPSNPPLGAAADPALFPFERVRQIRAEKFAAEGVDALATLELRDLRPRDAMSNAYVFFLATLNNSIGNHALAFVHLNELIQRSYSPVFTELGVQLIFPSAFWEMIQAQAATVKLDPLLLISQMKQESSFDARALSGAGASGLLQLMPGTAFEIESNLMRSDLVHPETNIRLGAKYLKKLLTKYNGNIVQALAAYNAGPGNCDRWTREGRFKGPMLEAIEQIPFKETREYVAAIIRNVYWYTTRLTPGAPLPKLDDFWKGGGGNG